MVLGVTMEKKKEDYKCSCGSEWVYNKDKNNDNSRVYRRTRKCPECGKKQIFMYDPNPKKHGEWVNI
jgi:predicted RNA-binding Zn-ribbon protein involved in translation (DUF1610 family)